MAGQGTWRPSMRRTLPFLYLGLNVACAAVVRSVVHGIAGLAAGEQRTVYDGVDRMTFLASPGPARLLGLLINVAGGSRAVVDVIQRRDGRATAWLGVAVAVWAVVAIGARASAQANATPTRQVPLHPPGGPAARRGA